MEMENRSNQENGMREQLLTLAGHLFYQLARIFLRHNVLIPELNQVLAWSAVNAALNEPEFAVANRNEHKQTLSHAAVLTGMTRTQVKKASEYETPSVPADGGDLNRVIRILTAWRTDEGYQDLTGNPIDLPVRGGTPSLHQLCRKYGRDTPVRAIADMLVKNGNAIWRASEGGVADKRLQYVHSVAAAESRSPADGAIMTQVGSDFTYSFQQAFDSAVQPQPRFREGYFNDIDVEKAGEAIDFLYREIHEFGLRCTEGLKKYRAAPGKAVTRIGAGAYSFNGAPLLLEGAALTEDKAEDTTKRSKK